LERGLIKCVVTFWGIRNRTNHTHIFSIKTALILNIFDVSKLTQNLVPLYVFLYGKQKESDNYGIFLSSCRWIDPSEHWKKWENSKQLHWPKITYIPNPHNTLSFFMYVYMLRNEFQRVLIYYGMLLRSAEFEHITHILTPPILVRFQFRQMFRIQCSILVYGMGPVGKQNQVDSVGKLWYCPSLGKMWNPRRKPMNTPKRWNPRNVPLTEKNLSIESV
jgi:hypothetical protein